MKTSGRKPVFFCRQPPSVPSNISLIQRYLTVTWAIAARARMLQLAAQGSLKGNASGRIASGEWKARRAQPFFLFNHAAIPAIRQKPELRWLSYGSDLFS